MPSRSCRRQGDTHHDRTFDYTGKRVVVTGGATGVGAALLDLLAELGASDVTVLDIKQPTGPHKTRSSRPTSATRGRRQPRSARSQDRSTCCSTTPASPTTLPSEVVFTINALALRHLSESLLPRIREGGAIVNTASIAGAQWPAHLEQAHFGPHTPTGLTGFLDGFGS